MSPELRRFVTLTWTLAITEWRLRFYGSALGVLWTLVRPFLFFAVLYVVFVEIAKVGDDVVNYPEYLLLGVMLFTFFSEVTDGSVGALVHRGDMLRKIKIPHLVVPLSIAVTALLNLGMTLLAAAILLAALGTYPSLDWLQLIPLIALLLVFGLGIGLFLSALFVRFRDIQPIWGVFSQMLFYASPVLYVATQVPADYLRPYLANPIASILTQMRHAIVDPGAAGAAEAIGGTARLMIPLGIIFGMFALGLWVFHREAPRVAEHL